MSIVASTDGRREIATIGLVGSAHFMSHVMQLAVPPLFPLLTVVFGASFTELGLVMTLFSLASGLGQATAGVLVDRYGASRLLIGGLTAISAAIAAIGAATHYWMLLPLAVVAGLGNSVFHPADLSILSHLVGKQRLGRAYAVHGLAGSIGFAVSPVLVTAIAGLYSWRAALITVGAIGLSVAAMLYLRRPMLVYNRPEPGCSEGEARRRGSYRNVIGSPIVLLAFAYFALTAFAGSGVQTFGVSALKEGYGMALQLATLALACYLVGSSCGVFVGGFLADRTEQHHRVAMSGIATSAVLVFVVSGLSDIGGIAALLLFAAGFAAGITAPSRDVLVRRAAAGAGAGTGSIFGFVYSGFDIGGSLAPLIFGTLLDHHRARLVFLVIGAAFALATPTVMQVQSRVLRRRRMAAAAE
ncbi:MAG TPA: MFS transporter [Stellaceae bacterium]|nr:MFS transporter [Stellaceae bacterium]